MQKTPSLHIVAFDIPFPADYGGVMDIFYKIKALHQLGVTITLHCWQYRDRLPQAELEKYCEKIYYYKRDMSPLSMLYSFATGVPFITASRTKRALLKNLKADTHPILFEGIHSCGYLDDSALKNRLKIVRMHNIEWQYYRNLEELESDLSKKAYFKTESLKLKRFENQILKHVDYLLTISPDDDEYYKKQFEAQNLNENLIVYIPPFHPNETVEIKTGRGNYVLFHGKLSVSDNEKVALYLIESIFSKIEIPFIIAGKEPSDKLKRAVARYENISLVANPKEADMNTLIQEAQINLLLSFQRSGMKLKLLNALYRGRFCIVNRHMVQNTGLETLCQIKNTSREIRAAVESYMNVQFTANAIHERSEILENGFSTLENAKEILKIIVQ